MVCRQKRRLMPINQIWPAYPFYFQCLRRPWAHRTRNRRQKICKSKHATVTLYTPYIDGISSLCYVMKSVANSFHYRVYWLTPLVAVHWPSPLRQESHTLRQHTCPSRRALDRHYPNPDTHTCTVRERTNQHTNRDNIQLRGFKHRCNPSNSDLLHCKGISLLMVQVLLQIEECVIEYMCHPAALQISKSNFTCQEMSFVYITHTFIHWTGTFNQSKFMGIPGNLSVLSYIDIFTLGRNFYLKLLLAKSW